MIESKVNAFNAKLMPPSGVHEVGRYLNAASRALRVKSDSELSRLIGVAPSTLASWKARGSIPSEHSDWFRANLIGKIARTHDALPECSMTARSAVVELFAQTGGNPLGVERLTLTVGASMLAPLLAIAQFFAELDGADPRLLKSETVYAIVDLLVGCIPLLRQLLNPEIL